MDKLYKVLCQHFVWPSLPRLSAKVYIELDPSLPLTVIPKSFLTGSQLKGTVFFFRGKDWVHSLTHIWKKQYFFPDCYIFFSDSFLIFFFSKYVVGPNPIIYSKLWSQKNKNKNRKKKHTMFTHSINFEWKWQKSNIFQK